eukprot:scaffold289148_cov26-Tisochrysis_lutea.AAC.3
MGETHGGSGASRVREPRGRRGTVNQAVVPPCSLRSMPATPPMMRTLLATEANPSPVPPRVPSTCENGRKSLSAASWLMPTPVSSTAKSTSSSVRLAGS